MGGAFYSHAHQAWRVEFSIERNGEWHTSSFYCAERVDAERLSAEAPGGRITVEGWCELYMLAMKIASTSNGFLYRVMLDGREEIFRERAKAIQPGGYIA